MIQFIFESRTNQGHLTRLGTSWESSSSLVDPHGCLRKSMDFGAARPCEGPDWSFLGQDTHLKFDCVADDASRRSGVGQAFSGPKRSSALARSLAVLSRLLF